MIRAMGAVRRWVDSGNGIHDLVLLLLLSVTDDVPAAAAIIERLKIDDSNRVLYCTA